MIKELSGTWRGCRQPRGFCVDPGQERAVRFIQQNVSKDQAIVVGNSHHRRLLDNDALFYFLPSAQRLDDFLRKGYRTIQTFGHYSICERG